MGKSKYGGGFFPQLQWHICNCSSPITINLKLTENIRTDVVLMFDNPQTPSREANRSSATQEIPRILWNLKITFRIRKGPSPKISVRFRG
jgi:hypothetical protein